MRADSAAGALAPPTSTTGRDSMSSRRDSTSSRSDTTSGKASAANQTQSGVTNAKTGKSTLGAGVKKTEPTQGQPVTSKGDTLVKHKKP